MLKWVLRTQRGREPCIYLTHDWEYWWALVNMEINLWVPWGVGNFMTSSATIHFSKRILLLEVALKISNTYQRAFLPQWPIMKERSHLFYVFRAVMATIHGINTSHSNLNYVTKCNSSSPQVFAAGVQFTTSASQDELSWMLKIIPIISYNYICCIQGKDGNWNVFLETMDNIQHLMQFIPESQSS
jgi:hypothetical protein